MKFKKELEIIIRSSQKRLLLNLIIFASLVVGISLIGGAFLSSLFAFILILAFALIGCFKTIPAYKARLSVARKIFEELSSYLEMNESLLKKDLDNHGEKLVKIIVSSVEARVSLEFETNNDNNDSRLIGFTGNLGSIDFIEDYDINNSLIAINKLLCGVVLIWVIEVLGSSDRNLLEKQPMGKMVFEVAIEDLRKTIIINESFDSSKKKVVDNFIIPSL